MWLKRKLIEKQLTPQRNRKRVGIILLGLSIAIFVIFAVRLTMIIVSGKVAGVSLEEKTQELYNITQNIEAKRGTIYDRNGNILAEDSTSFSLYANLDETYIGPNEKKLYVQKKDHEAIAEILAKNAGIDKSLVLKQLVPQKNDEGNLVTTVEFGPKGQNLNFEVKNNIEKELKEKGIVGIYFRENKKRSYLFGDFASHFIGYTQVDDENKRVGMMGIEAAFDEQLSGSNGWARYKKESQNDNYLGLDPIEKKDAEDGEDIYTTLDANLQTYLEELLSETQEKYNPEFITASLVEANTGNIIAAAQQPSFNLDTMAGIENDNFTWMNRLVEDIYEPGSTMKPFMIAAALQENKFSENETFQSGSIKIDDATINDWNGGTGNGAMTFRQALAWSSNVGMVQLHERMPEQWQNYVNAFGFLKPTGIDLPNEAAGNIQNSTTVDRAMTSYGQAISVTHLQMIQAYTAIANNGTMLKPTIIQKVVHSDGTETLVEPEVKGNPISSETAHKVLEYMGDVVSDPVYGMGKQYGMDGVNVAAKTGTAEFFENGAYNKQEYLHSVVQIVPRENPKYIFYMTIKKPTLDGTSANDIISNVSNKLLQRALILEND